jgi:hypothetical protein
VRYVEILKMEPAEESAAVHRAAKRVPRTIHYKWDDAYSRLLQQAEAAASPLDDVIVEYRDPVNGASVLPTLGCYLQMIRPGVATHAHCQTSTAVYHVVRGRGATTIGEGATTGRPVISSSSRRICRTRTRTRIAAASRRFCSRCRTCRCSKRSASTSSRRVRPPNLSLACADSDVSVGSRRLFRSYRSFSAVSFRSRESRRHDR